MADYYPTLARAVGHLNTNSAEARLELFERARTILRSHHCDGPEYDLMREQSALECAIRRVETEATFGGAALSTSFPLAPSLSVTAGTHGLDRESDPTSLRLHEHADTVSLTIASPPTFRAPKNRGGIPDPGRRVVAPDIVSIPFEDFEEADTTDNIYRPPSRRRRDLGLGTEAFDDSRLDITAENGPEAYGLTAPYAKVGKRKKLRLAAPRRPTAVDQGLLIMVLLLFLAFIGTGLALSIANLPRLVWELEHAPDHPQLLAVLVSAGSSVGILFFAIACRGIPRSVLAAIDAIGSVRLGIPLGKMGRSAGEFSDRL